ncbi:MAG: glycosyltransferase family 2 protein [Jatrophihabitans sp.]
MGAFSRHSLDSVATERRIAAACSDPVDLVTVVVPARNEQDRLAACLNSVRDQSWPHLQIIVVDGASTDRTVDVASACRQEDPRVELLHNAQGIIPISLNVALAAARGRWLVRVDAHSTIPPDYVAAAVQHLRTGKWGGVGGRKDGVGETAAGHAIAAAMGSRFGVGNSTYHHGRRLQEVEHIPFGCYPVELLRAVGGWDETLPVNQDFELDYRLRKLGKTLLFDPSLVINWRCQQRVPDLFQQYRRYGRGKVRVAVRHPRSVRLRHLVAPAFVAALGAAVVAAPWRPKLAGALVLPYAVALATASVSTIVRLPDQRSRRWVAPAFAAMHVGWGLGFWSAAADELRGAIVQVRPAKSS